MKLNLKQVLGLAGLNKPMYDSRRRRDLYTFLHASLSDNPAVADYENGRDRWGLHHVVAMVAIEQGVACGLTLEMADSIVANNFGDLWGALDEGTIDPDPDTNRHLSGDTGHLFAGAIFGKVGRGHHFGPMALFRDKVLKETVLVDTGEYHDEFSVVGMALIDTTVAYRTVKSRLLSGLKAD